MTARRLTDLPKDLDKQISRDFNALIKKVHAQLSTKKRSPVYTGFFASSWKAQNTPVKATDRVEKFKPWSGIKKQAMTAFLAGTGGNKPQNPVIQPRFPVKRAFNYKRPVYIGNKAKYAIYALEGGKIQLFIQGSLGKLIKETMTDKGLPKGKLFVQSGATTGFGSASPGSSYTEF
tara:strand:- start:29 stop:556 length:528 start_codon:yes stop_codon:yes gene_type:complete